MIRFIAKRLGSGAVVLLVVSALTFFLLYMSSGSIARNILGDQATAHLGSPATARAPTRRIRCARAEPA